MMKTVVYQDAAIADLPLLLQLMQEFYEHEQTSFDELVARQAVQTLMENPMFGRVWLIVSDEMAIGYVVLCLGYSLEYRGRDAYVDELYVRPAYRGQGVGTQTLAFMETVCRSLDVQAIHLEVAHRNTKARQLYQAVGYQDHDRYLMTKWLQE